MPLTQLIGQKSTFSDHGHVAYQIKGNHEFSNMVANILHADQILNNFTEMFLMMPSDSFTILGLWVLGLAVSHTNESNCKIMSPEHYFQWQVCNIIASWDSLKLKLCISETKLCAKDAGCAGNKITGCPLPKLQKWFCSAKKGVSRALDRKYLQMQSPEPLVQNQNNFTERFLMLPFTKIDQKVQLGWTAWLPELKIEISLNHINHISLATGQYIIYSYARTQVSNPRP